VIADSSDHNCRSHTEHFGVVLQLYGKKAEDLPDNCEEHALSDGLPVHLIRRASNRARASTLENFLDVPDFILSEMLLLWVPAKHNVTARFAPDD